MTTAMTWCTGISSIQYYTTADRDCSPCHCPITIMTTLLNLANITSRWPGRLGGLILSDCVTHKIRKLRLKCFINFQLDNILIIRVDNCDVLCPCNDISTVLFLIANLSWKVFIASVVQQTGIKEWVGNLGYLDPGQHSRAWHVSSSLSLYKVYKNIV